MKHLRLWAVLAALFYCPVALAQQGGTVSLNAFAVGLGPGIQGFKSVICTGFAVGTGSGSAPTCRLILSTDIPASVALTGTPTAPTAAVDTNTTQLATTAFVLGQAGSATPIIDGSAAVGTSTRYSRQDHVHPTDTTRAPLASPAFTGTPTAPTAAADTNTTQLATTAYMIGQASAATPLINGSAAIGTSLRYARADHVHPTDTTRAPTAGPVFTGSFTATGLVTYPALATAAIATCTQYEAATASTIAVPANVFCAETVTTYNLTTVFDFSTFINTAVTLTGNITTQTLSNVKAGQAGTITFIQDGTGSRTTVWNSIFKFAGGATPSLTATAAAIDVLAYSCRSATVCVASLLMNVK